MPIGKHLVEIALAQAVFVFGIGGREEFSFGIQQAVFANQLFGFLIAQE